MKVVPPWLVRWVRRVGTIDFALAALVSPVQNIISSPHTFTHFVSPHRIAQQAGKAVVLGRLSLCI
jgi:hypothetical protein